MYRWKNGCGSSFLVWMVVDNIGLWQVSFIVFAKNNAGKPIKSSFFPFYGSSEKQKYSPEANSNARTYKDFFVPYTTISLVDLSVPVFLPGFPQVIDIRSDGFLLLAKTTKLAKVHFLVSSSSNFLLPNGTWSFPTAMDVSDPASIPAHFQPYWAGTLDQTGDLPSDVADDNKTMWHNVTDIWSGGNYTVLLVVEDSPEKTGNLIGITEIVTPDTSAPTFKNITLVQSSTDETLGTFSFQLTIKLDEEAFVNFAAYSQQSCTAGDLASRVP